MNVKKIGRKDLWGNLSVENSRRENTQALGTQQGKKGRKDEVRKELMREITREGEEWG